MSDEAQSVARSGREAVRTEAERLKAAMGELFGEGLLDVRHARVPCACSRYYRHVDQACAEVMVRNPHARGLARRRQAENERKARGDAWLQALGFGDRLTDGRSAVGGLLARVVASMSNEQFDQWRLGRMLDRNYIRNRFGVGSRPGTSVPPFMPSGLTGVVRAASERETETVRAAKLRGTGNDRPRSAAPGRSDHSEG